MLSLNIVFLVVISLVAVIVTIYLILSVRGFSLNKILDFFHFNFPKFNYEFETCVTKYIENYEDLDSLCRVCENIGKKIKKSCYCFVVYSKNIKAASCEIRCNEVSNIWLVKYSLPDDKSMIEC